MSRTGIIAINGKDFPFGDGTSRLRFGGQEYSITEQTAKDLNEWVASGHQIITHEVYPTCPECNTTGDPDWEYCPFDGSKLETTGTVYTYEVDRHGNLVDVEK